MRAGILYVTCIFSDFWGSCLNNVVIGKGLDLLPGCVLSIVKFKSWKYNKQIYIIIQIKGKIKQYKPSQVVKSYRGFELIIKERLFLLYPVLPSFVYILSVSTIGILNCAMCAFVGVGECAFPLLWSNYKHSSNGNHNTKHMHHRLSYTSKW